jgi:hypothetical protein
LACSAFVLFGFGFVADGAGQRLLATVGVGSPAVQRDRDHA